MPEAKVIAAVKALKECLAASEHFAGLVEGWSVCSSIRDMRLPGVDVMPGLVERDGQTVVATVVFTIAAGTRGDVGTAIAKIYQIDRALWRVIHSQLKGDAANLFGSRLHYGGITTPPGPPDRADEETEAILVARAEAAYPYIETMD